jgi:hypothetical protein
MFAQLLVAAFLAISLSDHCWAHDCLPRARVNRMTHSIFGNELENTCHNILGDYFKYKQPQEHSDVPQDWEQARILYLQAIDELMNVTDFKPEDRKNYFIFIQLYNQTINNDELWNLMIALETDLARVYEANKKHSWCPMPKPPTVSDSNQHAGFINVFCSKFSFGIDKLLEAFDGENYCKIAQTEDECDSITQAKKDDFRLELHECTILHVLRDQNETGNGTRYFDFGTNGFDYSDQHLDEYMKCLSQHVMPAVWPYVLKRYFYFHTAVLLKPTVLSKLETNLLKVCFFFINFIRRFY